MKTFITFLCIFLAITVKVALAQTPSNVLVDGSYYTNGQTAYLDCSKDEVVIAVPPVYDGGSGYLPMTVSTSSNFYVTAGSTTIDKHLHLDSNHQDGSIQVGYQGVSGNPTITIYIKQRPPMPTFTATPSICSTGSSATFSVSDSYSFQSTKPINLVWTTTGGVTVNGSSTYTSTSSTTSSVTVQWSSFGTVSVYAVIPDCGNVQGPSATVYVGTPSSSNITFTATGGSDPGSSLCSGSTWNFQANPNLPLSQYSYSWSIPTGSSNVSYFYSYGPNATITAGSSGGFLLQMDVTQNGCSTVGGSSRTFFIGSCFGFRVANNPTTDKLPVLFEAASTGKELPDLIRLYSDKNQVVKEVKVKERYTDSAIKNGFTVDIDVHELPRGTYYLQNFYNSEKSEAIRVLLQ